MQYVYRVKLLTLGEGEEIPERVDPNTTLTVQPIDGEHGPAAQAVLDGMARANESEGVDRSILVSCELVTRVDVHP